MLLRAIKQLGDQRVRSGLPREEWQIFIARACVVYQTRCQRRHVYDVQRNARIALAGQRVTLVGERVVRSKKIDDGKIGDGTFVHLHVRDFAAVRRPREAVLSRKFFRIHPV